MPRVPEVFRISDDDELALDEEIDARYLDDPADVDPWQEALLRRTAAETQGPLPTASAPAEAARALPARRDGEAAWRCVRCDSDDLSNENPDRRWTCLHCGSFETYAVNQSYRSVTSHGTWMFLPASSPTAASPGMLRQPPSHGPRESTASRPISRRQRRRHNQNLQGPGGPRGDDDYEDDHEEVAESERPTHDPSVDPEEFPAKPIKGSSGGKWRPTCRPTSCPASPPLSGSATGKGHGKDRHQGNAGPELGRNKNTMTSPVAASKASSGPSWTSRMGPERGVRWRGGTPPAPPQWKYEASDLRAYAKFSKKVTSVILHDCQRSCTGSLYQSFW